MSGYYITYITTIYIYICIYIYIYMYIYKANHWCDVIEAWYTCIFFKGCNEKGPTDWGTSKSLKLSSSHADFLLIHLHGLPKKIETINLSHLDFRDDDWYFAPTWTSQLGCLGNYDITFRFIDLCNPWHTICEVVLFNVPPGGRPRQGRTTIDFSLVN